MADVGNQQNSNHINHELFKRSYLVIKEYSGMWNKPWSNIHLKA